MRRQRAESLCVRPTTILRLMELINFPDGNRGAKCAVAVEHANEKSLLEDGLSDSTATPSDSGVDDCEPVFHETILRIAEARQGLV